MFALYKHFFLNKRKISINKKDNLLHPDSNLLGSNVLVFRSTHKVRTYLI